MIRCDACFGEGRAVPLEPCQATEGAERAGDEADPLVAEVEKMAHGERGPDGIVDADTIDREAIVHRRLMFRRKAIKGDELHPALGKYPEMIEGYRG